MPIFSRLDDGGDVLSASCVCETTRDQERGEQLRGDSIEVLVELVDEILRSGGNPPDTGREIAVIARDRASPEAETRLVTLEQLRIMQTRAIQLINHLTSLKWPPDGHSQYSEDRGGDS